MDTLFAVLFESSVRAILIAIAVACVLRAMRVMSPAVSHRTWTGVLLVMVFLPLLSLWAPKIAIPLLPESPVPQRFEGAVVVPHSTLWGHLPATGNKISASACSNVASSVPMKNRPRSKIGIYQTVLIVYLTGVCFLVGRLLTGMLISYQLMRSGQRDDKEIYDSRCAVPLTIGLFHARILLPLDSKHWESDKLNAVLAHEREHVRRHDPLITWLALLNRCIYWFHPLAWWLCGKLTALAEQTCDETVLSKGYDSRVYTEYLLDFAHSVRHKGALVTEWGSPFHGSKLKLRIRRILISGRTPAISRARLIAFTVLCAGATLVPTLGKLARAHTTLPRLIPALSTAPSNLKENPFQLDQARVQAVPVSRSNLPNEPQKTAPPGVLASQSEPNQSDLSNPPDKTLFETGQEFLKESQYIKARLTFQTLMNTYPDSEMASDALLAIGDSYYDEGGTENLLQAEDSYKNFVVFFPASPKVQDAGFKIIALNVRMMHAPDRDARNAYKAEEAITRFLQQHPDSDYVPIAKQSLLDVQDNLALGSFKTAQFYTSRGNYAGAIMRLRTIIDKYPNFSRIDEVKRLYDALSTTKQQPQELPQK